MELQTAIASRVIAAEEVKSVAATTPPPEVRGVLIFPFYEVFDIICACILQVDRYIQHQHLVQASVLA
jgi:hypothetical protein